MQRAIESGAPLVGGGFCSATAGVSFPMYIVVSTNLRACVCCLHPSSCVPLPSPPGIGGRALKVVWMVSLCRRCRLAALSLSSVSVRFFSFFFSSPAELNLSVKKVYFS